MLCSNKVARCILLEDRQMSHDLIGIAPCLCSWWSSVLHDFNCLLDLVPILITLFAQSQRLIKDMVIVNNTVPRRFVSGRGGFKEKGSAAYGRGSSVA